VAADPGRTILSSGGGSGIRIPRILAGNRFHSKVYPRPYPRPEDQFGRAVAACNAALVVKRHPEWPPVLPHRAMLPRRWLAATTCWSAAVPAGTAADTSIAIIASARCTGLARPVLHHRGQPQTDHRALEEPRHGHYATGPAPRTGALGRMTSVYCEDPDGNLVEVATYSADP
jgi:hypothetical protein